jgi:hypothetical protein
VKKDRALGVGEFKIKIYDTSNKTPALLASVAHFSLPMHLTILLLCY